MPFFRYTATDASGRQVDGLLQASNQLAARAALRSAGMSAVDLRDADATGPSQTAPVPTPGHHAPPPPTPLAAPRPQPARAVPPIRTRRGSDSDVSFILSQLQSLAHSGTGLASALTVVSTRSSPRYVESLVYASARVTEGGPLSEALSRYPDLYPEHVVGAIRAGERAGALPEAFGKGADTAMRAHRLRKRLGLYLAIAVAIPAIAPLSMAVIRGSLDAIRAQDRAGGTLAPGQAVWNGIVEHLKGLGPVALALVLALLAFLHVWAMPQLRRARHQLGLRFPILGRRARLEAVSCLTWAMGLAARAGMAHRDALRLGAETIPNLVLRERVLAEAAGVRENEPISRGLRQSTILQPNHVDMIENGEATGNLPRALADIERVAQAEFEAADAKASVALGLVLYLLLAAVTTVLVVILAATWYQGLIDWGLNAD